MTYDQWKTDPDPYGHYSYDYEHEEPEDECAHEYYERDILTGLATCENCDHRWYLSNEQVRADMARETEYAKWQRRERRREYWRDLTYPIRFRTYRLLSRIWPRKACSVLVDDEIPF